MTASTLGGPGKAVRQPRPTRDVSAGLVRLIRALGRRLSNGRPDQLRYLQALDRALGEAWDEAIEGLREHGHSNVEIAEALGVTRQAVAKRWPGGGRYVGSAGRYVEAGAGLPTVGRGGPDSL